MQPDYLVSAQWLLAKLGSSERFRMSKSIIPGTASRFLGPWWCVLRRAILKDAGKDDRYGDYWREMRRSGAD